jgi:hypothetical protein
VIANVQRSALVTVHFGGGPASPASPLARREGAPALSADEFRKSAAPSLSLLYELQIYARETQRYQGEAAILGKRDAIELARHKLEQAVEKAKEEAEKKAGWGGIFDKLTAVAKVAALVASAASLIATGGMSAPLALGLAGTVMSMSAKPIGKLAGSEALEKGLLYGGAVVSLCGAGVGAWQAFTGTAQASGSAFGAASTFSAISKGATITSGLASAGSGYALYQAGRHGALELEARADEKETLAMRRMAMRQLDELIELLKESLGSFNKRLDSLGKSMNEDAACKLTLARLGGRA